MFNTPARQYTILKPGLYSDEEQANLAAICTQFGFEGTEVFMDDVVPRDLPLFTTEAEKQKLVADLTALQVKRLHCSYWAYPTSFLTKNNFAELVQRFGGIDEVKAYYGDLTGAHMFSRWQQEYELATALGAQGYTFHLIDYAPIDGAWPFTISKQDIRQAMVFMTQQLLAHLSEAGLLTEASPDIEIENAGWGLEHGTQTADDYKLVFDQLYDPLGKVTIAWEINHIMHAIGAGDAPGSAKFMLPDEEITPAMAELEAQYGQNAAVFAQKWVEMNVMDERLIQKVGALHLSDCVLKQIEYFANGRLTPPYDAEIDALQTWEEKEEYGVAIVLEHYDSHVPLGTGVLEAAPFRAMLDSLVAQNPRAVLLHELKNAKPQVPALEGQLAWLQNG